MNDKNVAMMARDAKEAAKTGNYLAMTCKNLYMVDISFIKVRKINFVPGYDSSSSTITHKREKHTQKHRN